MKNQVHPSVADPQFDVAIVGAGIVGLCATIAMAQKNFSVMLLEQNPLAAISLSPSSHSLNGGRVFAINKQSQALLEEIGVWSLLDFKSISPYQAMEIWEAESLETLYFDSRLIYEPVIGFIIPEIILKQALWQRIKDYPQIRVRSATEIENFYCEKNLLRLKSSDGIEEVTIQLLMIVDGANSATRDRLEIPLTSWSYHQKSLVSTVTTEKEHGKVAYQVFNKGQILAFLPLADPHSSSIVWSLPIVQADQLLELKPTDFVRALAETFGTKLGSILKAESPLSFPLMMRQAQHYRGKNWLLMGDAAHTIHPMAGLGLNLGLADLQAWLTNLRQTNNALLSARALGKYQRERKYAVWKIILALESLKFLFTCPIPPIRRLSSLGLKTVNQMHLLKKYFIQQASYEL